MPKINIQLGADPELFVKHVSSGKFVSAHNLLPGTKEKPFPVKAGAVQVDGVAAEFNITPAQSGLAWSNNIKLVMAKLAEMIGPDYSLEHVPAVVFEPEYFNSLPEDVRVLGCNMDYNAWTGQPNPRPDGGATTMRTAAGHIHIGWTQDEDPNDPDHFEDCCEVVKQLDYFLGVPSLLWDNDPRRRSLYGKAGAFRPKSYGCEYRTLSNRWLSNVTLMGWVYASSIQAVSGMFYNNLRMVKKFNNLAQDIIDTNNLDFVKSDEFRRDVWTGTEFEWPTW